MPYVIASTLVCTELSSHFQPVAYGERVKIGNHSTMLTLPKSPSASGSEASEAHSQCNTALANKPREFVSEFLPVGPLKDNPPEL